MDSTPTYQKVLFGCWGIAVLTCTSLWTGAIGDQSYSRPLRTCIVYFKSLLDSPSSYCDTSTHFGYFMILFSFCIISFRGYYLFSFRHLHKYPHSVYVALLWITSITAIIISLLFLEGLKTTCNSQSTFRSIGCTSIGQMSSDFSRFNINFTTIQAGLYGGFISSGLFFLIAIVESIRLYKSFQVPDTLINIKATNQV
jgi:hypothetical protein